MLIVGSGLIAGAGLGRPRRAVPGCDAGEGYQRQFAAVVPGPRRADS